MFLFEYIIKGNVLHCLKSWLTELKELNSALTTEEVMSEIKELKAECSGYRARVEKIKSATNHVTPEEREKVNISETYSIYFN